MAQCVRKHRLWDEATVCEITLTCFRVLRLQTAPLYYKSASESIRKFTALLKKTKLLSREQSYRFLLGADGMFNICLGGEPTPHLNWTPWLWGVKTTHWNEMWSAVIAWQDTVNLLIPQQCTKTILTGSLQSNLPSPGKLLLWNEICEATACLKQWRYIFFFVCFS